MKDFHEQTYYELLDVKANSSQEEILKAYNRARSTYGNNSPALYSLFNKEEAQELLKLIDEAYTTLSNPFKRKQYDKNAGQYHNENKESVKSEPFRNEIRDSSLTESDQDLAIPNAHDLTFYSDSGGGESAASEVNISAPARETPTEQESGAIGATIFSRYKIDPAFEQEIKATEAFSGNVIHKIRLYKNVTLDQISEMTKVSRAYLTAVENDNYSSLPAAVFTRGFLVQISKILNIDTNKVTSSYLRLMKEKK